MLHLRLARGYGLADHARLLLTSAAAAGAAAVLLRALGHALTTEHLAARVPGVTSASVARLLWCLPALAALGYLTAVCTRSLPECRPERVGGLDAAGAGPVRMRLLVASETAAACGVGVVLALAGFLAVRGRLVAALPGHRLAPALGIGDRLPVVGLLALLATVPLVGSAVAAASVRAAGRRPMRSAEDEPVRVPSSGYTAAAVVLLVAGAALDVGARRVAGVPGGRLLHLPGFGRASLVGLVGASAAEAGLALATPVLLYVVGQLLAAGQPRAVRLLAGRGLQAASWRLGGPLAVTALLAGLVAASLVLGNARLRAPFALTELVLVCACALGAALARAAEVRARRRRITAPLRSFGAPALRFRAAAVLRFAAAAAVALAVAGAAAALAAGCTA